MRNKYPGTCYRCGKHTAKGEGHFERYRGGWRVHCAPCARMNHKAKQIEALPSAPPSGTDS